MHDKNRLVEIGSALQDAGVEIISTGLTGKLLRENGIKVGEVSDYTGFPEILDGRVKTLHPRIHSGILADQGNSEHLAKLDELEIEPFDLVIINLYPFAAAIATGADYVECIEQIDVGGTSLLRAAAKNHTSVAAISNPNQYDQLLSALKNGGFTQAERKELAIQVFRTTAEYDATIAMWLNQEQGYFPDWIAGVWRKSATLRYGENPHQQAVVYASNFPGIVSAKQLHGKEMSFNNYTDADAALRAVYDHNKPAVAIIKHGNPCGVAIGRDISDAYRAALECDPISAFGGVVATNRILTIDMANELSKNFTEVIVAPGYDDRALEILKGRSNLRILLTDFKDYGPLEPRSLSGGLLVQSADLLNSEGDDPKNWRQVAGAKASSEILSDLEFAWRAVRAVKSNAIIIARNGAAVGIGMGQVNRLDAAKLAVNKAGIRAKGSVAASDAFFPFSDGLQVLVDSGISAVVSPGGSLRDEEVIAVASQANIALFFTGTRHFSHT